MVVWRVDGDGSISLHQSIDLPVGAGFFGVDPLGRFVVFNTSFVDPTGPDIFHTELWRIEGDHTLTLADVISGETSGFAATRSTLTMDGKWWVSFGNDFSAEPVIARDFVQAIRITEDLRLEPGGVPLPLAFDSALKSSLRLRAIGDGPVIPLLAESSQPNFFVLQMTASGEITWDGSAIPIQGQAAGGTGTDPRLDGRVAVASRFATSFAIDASGGVVKIEETGPVGLSNPRFVAGGRSALGSPDARRIAIGRDGTYPGDWTLAGLPSGIVHGVTVTHDGRIAMYNNQTTSRAVTFSTFALEGRTDLVPLDSLRHNGPLQDVRFLPPRTVDLLGDANADGVRDITDVVTYTNHFGDDPGLGGPTDPTIAGPVPRARADADQDGDIDGDDLSWLVGFLLGI
jgi:hypothetical protein